MIAKFRFPVLLALLIAGGPNLHAIAGIDGNDSIRRVVDSLKSRLPGLKGEERYEAAFRVAFELFELDGHEALGYAEEAFKLARDLGNTPEIIRSGKLWGQLLRMADRSEEGIRHLDTLLLVAKSRGFHEEDAAIHNTLALCYTTVARYDNALEHHFKSLEITESRGDAKMLGVTYNNIGVVYYKLMNFDKALEFYNSSLNAKKEAKDFFDLDRLLINIGQCHAYLGNYRLAEESIYDAFKVCGAGCTERITMEGEFALAFSNLLAQENRGATKHFLKSLMLAEKIGDKRFEAESLSGLGRLHFVQGTFDRAEANFLKVVALCQDAGYNEILSGAYRYLFQIYSRFEDFKAASAYQEKYIGLRDSMNSKEFIKNLTRVQSEFEERENRMRISNREQTIVLREETIAKQKLLGVFAAATILLLAIVSALAYRLAAFRKQVSAQLDKRIQERSTELALSRNELVRESYDREIFLVFIARRLKASLATVKGLGLVVSKEGDHLAEEYAGKFEAIARQLEEVIGLIHKKCNPTRST